MDAPNSPTMTKPGLNEEETELTEELIAEEKRLVRKIDLMLMPAIWCTYLFSYADRTK